MVCQRKRKKRKKQKKKKTNKERKVVEKKDRISEQEEERKEKTTIDLVLPKGPSVMVQLWEGYITRKIPKEVQDTTTRYNEMQLYNRIEMRERLQLQTSVYLRRLIEGPAVPTLCDIYLYQKLRPLGVYRRAGEVWLAVRKEESGTFEIDRTRKVSRDTWATIVDKTPQFAKIVFDDYICRDPECPVHYGDNNSCTDPGVKRCDGWVRWKYLLPGIGILKYNQGRRIQTNSKQEAEGWSSGAELGLLS